MNERKTREVPNLKVITDQFGPKISKSPLRSIVEAENFMSGVRHSGILVPADVEVMHDYRLTRYYGELRREIGNPNGPRLVDPPPIIA